MTGAAKWARLAELGPDVAIGLEALARTNPRHPLLHELNRLRADVHVARLVLRTRSRTALDLSLLTRAEAWLAEHPLRDARARLGQAALTRELDRWVQTQRARLDDWFLERLAELPLAHERVAVFTWLVEGASPPRPIHRLSRAVRLRDFAEIEHALRECPLDDASRALHGRARQLLEQHRRGVARPLERVLRVSSS